MLHGGSLRAGVCIAGMFVGVLVLVTKSMAMAFVDQGDCGIARRDRRFTAFGVLRTLEIRLFGILVLLYVLFPGLPICSVFSTLQKVMYSFW